MRLRPLFLLLLLLGACEPERETEPAPASHRAVLLPGVRLEAPVGDDWFAVERRAERVVLERIRPDTTARLVAETIAMDASSDDETFVRAAEARREEAVSSLEMVSEHYYSMTLDGVACLAYDGTYRDSSADQAGRFRMLKGYVCPTNAGVVQLELSVFSASRTPPEADALLAIADAFFRSATFAR